MDDKANAMFGTVSHNGGLWILHFPAHGSTCNIVHEGYGPDVFKGFTGPVIRFDKAPLQNVLDWLKGPPIGVKGHGCGCSWDREITLEEYLDRARSFGIPVEEWGGEKNKTSNG